MTDSSSNPKWLKNYWHIFESIRIRSDFIDDLDLLRQKRAKDTNPLPLIADSWLKKLVHKHKVPPSCIGAVEHLVYHPNASNDELKDKILSPIMWIHPSMEKLGPKNEYIDYKTWVHAKKGAYFGSSLLIEVRPNTKISEIKDFLNEYKDDLNKALKSSQPWLNNDYPVEYASRIDKPDYIGEKALILRDKGLKAPQILEELDLKDKIDESNIRAMISNARKRRNERNKNS